MKKRFACLLLAVVMLIGVLPAGFMNVSAAATMALSDDGLTFIEDFIGFEDEAYEEPEDSGNWYIGYHTPSVEDASITEDKAEIALREAITKSGAVSNVNAALSQNVVQKQFDALVALTYLYGVNPSTSMGGVTFAKYVTDASRSGSQIANAICVEIDNCKNEQTVNDRLAIANLFVNGGYDTDDNGEFGYTGFRAARGYFGTKGDNIRFQAYDVRTQNEISIKDQSKLKHDDPRNTFYGWYISDDDDNEMITYLDDDTDGLILRARWRRADGHMDTDYSMPALVLFVASGTNPTGTMPVHATASDSSKVISYLYSDEDIDVVTEAVVGTDMWVELDEGGWVKLGKVDAIPVLSAPKDVTITDDYVNVRAYPDANSTKLTQLERGDVVTIYMSKGNWGFCEEGWLLLVYTDYSASGSNVPDPDDGDTVVAKAKVTSDSLNIRNNPSASSTYVGALAINKVVDVYEITTVAGHKWGRIDQGWICLTYTDLSYVTPSNNHSSSSGKANGVIVNAAEVNVRSGPSATANKIGTVPMGTTVSVQKTEDSSTASWALTEYGWICTDYIRMNSEIPYGKQAVVNSGISLAVRANAGTEYMKVTALPGGTVVEIQSTKVVQGVQWGKVAQGWINMSYVTMKNSGPETNGIGATIVNVSKAANVRVAPGTTNQMVGTIALGSHVYITEREPVKGTYWYHIEKGWVIGDYVKLDSEWVDPQEPDPIDPIIPTIFNGYPGIVTTLAGTTSVYETPSSDAKVVMTMKTLTKVYIRERKLVGEKEFGKVIVGTVTGWVNMADVLMGAVNAEVVAVKTDVYEEPNVRSSFQASLPRGTVVAIAPDTGAAKAQRGQIYDGTTLWGKITYAGKTGWIKLADVNMFEDNAKPIGKFSKSGAGYLVGATGGATDVYADNNGTPNLSKKTAFKLVDGQRVTILDRFMVEAGGENYGKIKLGSDYCWIRMDTVTLEPVEMEVTTNNLKAYNNYTDTNPVLTLKEGDVVTLKSRILNQNGELFNDWGRVYINDDMSKYYWIILDEGKLEYLDDEFETPEDRDVLVTVAVTTRTKNEAKVYEEIDTSSKVILTVKKNGIITVQNWKNDTAGNTWCKVKVGDIIGWMQMSDLDFSKLTGTVAVSSLRVYTKPDFDSKVDLLTISGTKVTVTDIQYIDDALWGYLSLATKTGWINLAHINLDVPTDDTKTEDYTPAILTGKINSVDQNVDVYPDPDGTGLNPLLNPISLPKNTKVEITDIKTLTFKAKLKTCVAAKLELGERDGWIEFAKITPNAAVATVNGSKIEVCTDLEHNKSFYTLYRDEKVNVVSFKEYNNKLFGEIIIKGESGWILIADSNGLNVTLTPGSTSSSTDTPSTPTVAPTTPVVVGTPATIVCSATVNVRNAPETTAQQVSTLTNGSVVTIYEEAVSSLGKKWARIGAGQWVCMDYVKYGTGGASGVITDPVIVTTTPSGANAVGFATRDLEVYGGDGYGYGKTGTIPKNSAVTIYENKLSQGVSWARTDSGWIILSYVKITAIGGEGSGQMGNVARTGSAAKVRSQAGINGVVLTDAMVSARVAVLETTTVSGETWGRTALGWVSLQYVAMDAEMPTVPTVGTVDSTGDVG